jgi:hypothetical protein
MSKLTVIQNKSQPEKAREIARTLGIYNAARYLWKRNWSVEAAVFILLGK